MHNRITVAASAAALGLAIGLVAAPASAAIVQVLAVTGAYTISYDPALQSLPITVTDGFNRTVIHFDGTFVGDPESGDLSDGITETVFHVLLHLTFTPTPGNVFTGVDISAGAAGWHHAFFGGEEFGEDTTLHPLFGGPDVVFSGPTFVNIPPWGQGGGGANQGTDFGSAVPPANGFTMDMDETIVLFDASSWTFGSNELDFQTAAAPTAAATGIPEPSSWALMIAGFTALGAAMRRRRALSCV